MATTTLLKVKSNSSESVKSSLKSSIDYIMNTNKTNDGKLIYSYACEPESAIFEFEHTKKMYEKKTGKITKADKDIIAYHLRQSFAPDDNITPEQANAIGRQLANEFLKGQHEYIVTTHIDKKHIHNHIIFNSTTIDSSHKFNNYKNTTFAIRNISDKLCKENNLSVVKTQERKGKSYKEWDETQKGTSWKFELKNNIDKLVKISNNFDELLTELNNLGYEIKKGKNIAFKAPGQERFTRAKTIGINYTEENIIKRIEQKVERSNLPKYTYDNKGKINLLIDIQSKIDNSNNPGFEQWAKINNLKEASKTLSFLTANKIENYSELENKVNDIKKSFNDIQNNIKSAETKLSEMAKMIKYINTYQETKPVHDDYKNAKNKNLFKQEHEGELILYSASLKALKEMSADGKININEVQNNYMELKKEKDKLYGDYKELKAIDSKYKTIKSNVDQIIRPQIINNENVKNRDNSL